MDPNENRQRRQARQTASQRAHIRRLRTQQKEQKDSKETWNRRGLPMWLRTIIVVGAVLILMLVFFRVDRFEVSGNVRYTADEVADASGITLGDVLMGVNKTKAASRILVKLPYVTQVTVAKTLPNTVSFTIQECSAMTAVQSEFGDWWLLNRDGKLLEKLEDAENLSKPQIQGVELQLPVAGDPATFSDALRQERAMEIALAVESAGLQSVIRWIDVTDPESILLSYEDRIEVQVGDGTDIAYKLQYMLGAIAKLQSGDRGSLDLSFADGNHAIFHPMNG